MTATKYRRFILCCFLLAIFGEIAAAQSPITDSEDLWFPLGGIKDKSGQEGLSKKQRQESFNGKISVQYDVAFIRKIVKELSNTARVDVELKFTDKLDHHVKAYEQTTIKARDGSIIIENAFMAKYLTAKDNGDFFKALLAHEIGHIVFFRNKTPFLLEIPSQIKIQKGKTVKDLDLKLKEEIFCDLLGGYYLRLTYTSSVLFDTNSVLFDNISQIVRNFDKFGDDRELQKRSHGAPFTRGVLFYSGFRLTDNPQSPRYQPHSGTTPVGINFVGFNDKGSLLLQIVYKYDGERIVESVTVSICHPDILDCEEMISY